MSGLKDDCSRNGERHGISNSATRGASQYSAPTGEPPLLHSGWTRISPWSGSAAKRAFDCIFVLLFLPFLIPLMAVLAIAIRLTSRGPVFFVQQRMGRHGKPFRILKFRTMVHVAPSRRQAVTTADNQQFTSLGPFLRRWKLDELPQLFNVLVGHMSLVGPRPKLPEHHVADLPCRPGITGAATIAFAREERMLAGIPKRQLDAYYHVLVLPAKRHLDAAYMARATFLSDIELIGRTLLRRWDDSVVRDLLTPENFRRHEAMRSSRVHVAHVSHTEVPAFTVAVEAASDGAGSL